MDVKNLRERLVALLKDNLLVKEVVPTLFEMSIITEEERQRLWHCNILRQQVRDLVDIILTKQNYMDKLKEMSTMLKQRPYLEHAFISPLMDEILDDALLLTGKDEKADTEVDGVRDSIPIEVQSSRQATISKRRTSNCIALNRLNSNNFTDSGISSIDSVFSLDENTEPKERIGGIVETRHESEISTKYRQAIGYLQQGLTNKYERTLLSLSGFCVAKVKSDKDSLNVLDACIKVVLANVPVTRGMERRLYNNCAFFVKHFKPVQIGARSTCDLYIACTLLCTKFLKYFSFRSSEKYADKAIKYLELCHGYVTTSADDFQLLQWRHCHMCLAKYFLRSDNINEDAPFFERAEQHLDNVDLCPLPLHSDFRNEFYRCKADLHYRRNNPNRALQYISQVYDNEDPPNVETHIREALFKKSLENGFSKKGEKRKLIVDKNDKLYISTKKRKITSQRLKNYINSKLLPRDPDKALAIDLYTNHVKVSCWKNGKQKDTNEPM